MRLCWRWKYYFQNIVILTLSEDMLCLSSSLNPLWYSGVSRGAWNRAQYEAPPALVQLPFYFHPINSLNFLEETLSPVTFRRLLLNFTSYEEFCLSLTFDTFDFSLIHWILFLIKIPGNQDQRSINEELILLWCFVKHVKDILLL